MKERRWKLPFLSISQGQSPLTLPPSHPRQVDAGAIPPLLPGPFWEGIGVRTAQLISISPPTLSTFLSSALPPNESLLRSFF